MPPATGVEAAKRAVRADMRAVRSRVAADPADRAARSARIWARVTALAGLDDGRARRVLLFDGLPTEPATEEWFQWCRARGIDVYAPAVDGPGLRVEPGDVVPALLDVVVVPGLAFTPDGRRLGQGGGHYDRFLARLRPGCVTVGVAFAEQVVADLPTAPHDRAVDHVATDAEDRQLSW